MGRARARFERRIRSPSHHEAFLRDRGTDHLESGCTYSFAFFLFVSADRANETRCSEDRPVTSSVPHPSPHFILPNLRPPRSAFLPSNKTYHFIPAKRCLPIY